MSSVLAGALAAFTASVLYNLGLAIQALDARALPADHALRPSLLRRLAKRRRWLVGTGLTLVGWLVQIVALMLAPLTLVQPMLAAGLLPLLLIGSRVLHEPIGRRELIGVGAIIAGVVVLALTAPGRTVGQATGIQLAVSLTAIGALAALPYLRTGRKVGSGTLVMASAGMAYSFSSFTTKLASDALTLHAWVVCVLWAAATAIGGGIGLLSEMSALQRVPATRVAPVIFVIEMVVPVTLAIVLAGESLRGTPLGGALVIAALAVVAGGAVVLSSSTAVAALVGPEESIAETGTSVTPSPRNPDNN
jgi:drug/metabolite transporter (DMT)-like permease